MVAVQCGDSGCETEGVENRECWPIPTPKNDPDFSDRECLMFVRTSVACEIFLFASTPVIYWAFSEVVSNDSAEHSSVIFIAVFIIQGVLGSYNLQNWKQFLALIECNVLII